MSEFTNSIVKCLEAFNRKERYWLIRNALEEGGRPLCLSETFRNRLSTSLDGLAIPETAWWGMDYHIDWLIGALLLHKHGEKITFGYNELPDQKRVVRGTQEDFDFIVAFDKTIIIVEAKGVTAWSNEQINAKCDRLTDLFSLPDLSEIDTRIYFLVTSPKNSASVPWSRFPEKVIGRKSGEKSEAFFMKMELGSPAPEFWRIQRSDGTGPSADGKYWQVLIDEQLKRSLEAGPSARIQQNPTAEV